jgi:hypothetical protein
MKGLTVAAIATLITATAVIAQQSVNAAPAPNVSFTAAGDAAYNKGDYATALHPYHQLADQGNVSAIRHREHVRRWPRRAVGTTRRRPCGFV